MKTQIKDADCEMLQKKCLTIWKGALNSQESKNAKYIFKVWGLILGVVNEKLQLRAC